MERARELARPWMEREGVIGIYVVGSSTRPHRDRLSDYDIEVVLTDEAYAATPDDGRHVLVLDEGPPKRVDHEFYLWPWTGFAALVDSRRDVFHYPYQHATILHDPSGRVAEVVRRLAELPEALRVERLKVHFLEFLFGAGRAGKTFDRGLDLAARLVAGESLVALVKTLFLAKRSWPSTLHWCGPELAALGVPDAILDPLRAVARDPTRESLKALTDAARPWLAAETDGLLEDPAVLGRWAFLTGEGKAAFEKWGGG